MMDDYEVRVAVARVRLDIREIDAEMEQIRQESQFYRRMGFGRDIKDIQMLALQEKRLEKEAELRALQRKVHARKHERTGPLSFLLLPVVLVLMLADAVVPKHSRAPRERVFTVSLRASTQAAGDVG
jgi:hypothetical protein